jgi:hypothetical protein
MSDNFYKHLDNSDTYYQALEKQNEELEAEVAKLKSDLMASEENEAWNLCKAKEFKEERDKLKSELASRGWQSAEKLPTEEGDYLIKILEYGVWRIYQKAYGGDILCTFDLNELKQTIAKRLIMINKTGIKYLKLPE